MDSRRFNEGIVTAALRDKFLKFFREEGRSVDEYLAGFGAALDELAKERKRQGSQSADLETVANAVWRAVTTASKVGGWPL